MDKIGAAIAVMGAAYLYSQNQENSSNEKSDVTIKFFHAPWCGYCKRFYPEWERLKEVLGSKFKDIKFEKINCDENKMECLSAGVRGYPTLMFVIGDRTITYQGERVVEEIEAALVREMNLLEEVEEAVEERVKETKAEELPPMTGALFLPAGNNNNVVQVWKEVESIFEGSPFTFSTIECESDKDICELYQIGNSPTVIFQFDKTKAAKYNGPMEVPMLLKFLTIMAKITN